MPGSKQAVPSEEDLDTTRTNKAKHPKQPQKIPKETADFLQFIQDNPNKKVITKELDTAARKYLGQKYVHFNQGCYAVVEHRAAQHAASSLVPGAQDEASTNDHTLRPRFWCTKCDDFKGDIGRHLAQHNKNPMTRVYCPYCLKDFHGDACTLPEHMINNHPYLVIEQPNPVQNSQRYKSMATTTESTKLSRMSLSALYSFILQDQHTLEHLLEVFMSKQHIDLRTLQEIDATFGNGAENSQIDLSKLVGTIRRLRDKPGRSLHFRVHGLARLIGISSLYKADAIEYLQGLREAMASLEPDA